MKCIESDPDNEGFIVHDGALYTRDMRELILYPSGSDEEEFVLPRSVECIRPGALLCARNLKRVSVEAGNDHFVSDDGILYSKDMRELVFHPSGRDIVLREGIEHVCSDAFSCSDITSVTIPEGTMSIGSYAFYGCKGLKEVALPGSLISIEQRAFYGCTSLETILFTGKQESVHIGERSFAYCPVGIDLRSGVDGWEFEAFRLEGTMLYSLPEEGIRHFSGVLGLMWYDDTE